MNTLRLMWEAASPRDRVIAGLAVGGLVVGSFIAVDQINDTRVPSQPDSRLTAVTPMPDSMAELNPASP